MTKKASKEIRINSVLDAAVSEFVEKGYENTSMDSIAARSGLTKGGLYYHFKCKDDILIKANERLLGPIYKMIDEAMSASTAVEGISSYIKNYLSYWAAHPRELSFVFITFIITLSNDKITNIFDGYTAQYINFLSSLYQKGIDNHEFKSFTARSTACALMSALDGVIGYIALDNTLTLEQAIKDFNDVFINQYLPKT